MNLAVIGAGAWGTALAVVAAGRGHDVTLWARREEQVKALESAHENLEHLPGVKLPEGLRATSNLEDVHDADFALLAVPSSYLLEVARGLPRVLQVVNCAKGLDEDLEPLTTGLEREGFSSVAVLSGPNLAHEIAHGLPAATVVASLNEELASTVQAALGGGNLRVYTSNDVIGVSLGGALKNVIALGAGLVDGLKLGENARAALVTRGLREIVRFALAHGARETTMYGLAGLGDLMLTCAAQSSRNRTAGERLARGLALEPGKAIEGIPTAERVVAWAHREGLELPVCETIHAIASGQLEPVRGVERLLSRGARSEMN
jgi:glycerol-3-phosphate dehydrogenase (NAD(P)+)